MEGKTLILSLLIVSLVLAQVRVEAKSCCPSTTARNIYNVCRLPGTSRDTCASLSGCKIQSSSTCQPPYIHMENNDDTMQSYCKLGCAFSECGLAYGEAARGDSEQCVDKCSELCSKGSTRRYEMA